MNPRRESSGAESSSQLGRKRNLASGLSWIDAEQRCRNAGQLDATPKPAERNARSDEAAGEWPGSTVDTDAGAALRSGSRALAPPSRH